MNADLPASPALTFPCRSVASFATATHHDALHHVQQAQRYAIPKTATASFRRSSRRRFRRVVAQSRGLQSRLHRQQRSNLIRAALTQSSRSLILSGGGFGRRWLSSWRCARRGRSSYARASPRSAIVLLGPAGAPLMHDGKRQGDFLLIGDRQSLQAAGRNMIGNHVARHVAPAEPGQQEIEPGR